MKKKQLSKKLSFKKTQISSLESSTISGGATATNCCSVDLSEIESCSPECNWTDTCLSVHCTIGCPNTGGSAGGTNYTCWPR